MASDPSIYGQIGVNVTPQVNPLAQYVQGLQARNELMGLQQRQAAFAGQQALAGAYQNVPLDPKTGLPDSTQLIANLRQTPGGGYVIPTAIQAMQEQQQRNYGLNKAQLDQTTARTNTVNSALNPLLRMGPDVQPNDIFSAIAGLHAAGMPTDEFVQDAAITLPTRQPGQSDGQYGQQLQSWVVNHASRSWDPGTQAANFTPRPGTLDTGGEINTRDVNPYTNPGIASAAPLGRTLSPGEQANPVRGPPGPGGAPTVITAATYAQQNGLGHLMPGGNSPLGNGRFPTALLNPNRQPVAAPSPASPGPSVQPASTSAGTPPTPLPVPQQQGYAPPAPQTAAPGAPMAVGLPPGQQTALDAAGKASTDQWAGLQNSVGGSAGRIYQLKSALGDLQALGSTGTGPSAGTVNNIKSYLQSLPVVGKHLGIDPNQVADYDTANKYLTGYASARAGARGGTTDSQLATTLSSNASTHISNLASQNVVKANIGLERMDQGQIAAFQKGLDPVTGQPTGQAFTPDQFADYSAKWNSAMDPRAFVADQLTPQAFHATVSGMQPAERTRFQNTFNTALTNGWIDPPAWMQGSQPAPAAAAPATAPPNPAPPNPARGY